MKLVKYKDKNGISWTGLDLTDKKGRGIPAKKLLKILQSSIKSGK